jgi:energy-coupling factor transporter ATP-binding protein EcfA2
MIEKLKIVGYRKFKNVTIELNPGLNIFVGDNESGKSTLLEAVLLVLTGYVNSRTAIEDLNPFWFNQEIVNEFFAERKKGNPVALPTILIEVFLSDLDSLQKLRGAHNSDSPTRECPGIRLEVKPNQDYGTEIEKHIASGSTLLPVEFYVIEWRSFADANIERRPREVSVAMIDSRTIRSSSGVDYYLRNMLNDTLSAEQWTQLSVAYRSVKETMTSTHLSNVNSELANLDGLFGDAKLSMAMDQTARTSWEGAVTPHLGNIPFAMTGQGHQAGVKILLAMARSAGSARIAMIEEPENHLSHTSLQKLLGAVEKVSGAEQQLLITTHSSFVLNRLGLNALRLISQGAVSPLTEISKDTIGYFKKLPGYDTLRVVLASKIVLVEGASEEILFNRFYRDKYQREPNEDGIDVICIRGLSFKRFLELAKLVDRKCAFLRDLDDYSESELDNHYKNHVSSNIRLFRGLVKNGTTLEPQLCAVNNNDTLVRVLALPDNRGAEEWMLKHKTESAIRIAEHQESLIPPDYFTEAIEFIHGKQG